MGRASVREQPSFGSGIPIRNVSWNECRKFIATLVDKIDDKLNELGPRAVEEFSGYYFSMPTELQWEYAYRKGFLKVYNEETLDWCSDLYDDTGNRVVRGSDDQRNGRDPKLWFGHVGFRLVIVPKGAE